MQTKIAAFCPGVNINHLLHLARHGAQHPAHGLPLLPPEAEEGAAQGGERAPGGLVPRLGRLDGEAQLDLQLPPVAWLVLAGLALQWLPPVESVYSEVSAAQDQVS